MDTTPRARTLRVQGLVNRIVRTILRTPVLAGLAGRRLVILEVVGRRSGRRFEVPVAYTRLDGGVLLIGTSFAWGRNLRTGDPITIRLRGRRRVADVEVLTGEDDVVAAYALMARDNHQFAGFNGIGFDEHGDPVLEDLQLARATGARAFRLTPRP